MILYLIIMDYIMLTVLNDLIAAIFITMKY